MLPKSIPDNVIGDLRKLRFDVLFRNRGTTISADGADEILIGLDLRYDGAESLFAAFRTGNLWVVIHGLFGFLLHAG